MAESSEAAKEPTMEEILASIRRIISEDDGEREQPDEVSAEAPQDDEPEQATEPVEEVESFDEAFQQTVDEPQSEVAQETYARVETGEERETSNPDSERYASIASVFTARQPVTVEDEDDGEYEEAHEAIESELAGPSAFQPEVVSDNTVRDDDVPTGGSSEEPMEEPFDEPVTFGGEEVAAEPDWAEPEYEPAVQTAAYVQDVDFSDVVDDEFEGMVEDELLSPSTQNKVADMLGQLNSGYASGEPAQGPARSAGTSVEEMVRQMLRPMLQDWLDQNLPGMVERMVEREIRRVTRGH